MVSNDLSLRDGENEHMKSNGSLLKEIQLRYSDVCYEHEPSHFLNVDVRKVFENKKIKIKNTYQSNKIFQFL